MGVEAGSGSVTNAGGAGASKVKGGPLLAASMPNFRDIAGPGDGPGYALHPSGTMARGQVYRSMALAAGAVDPGLLARLGVRTIVDLRTADEAARQPDVVPDGVDYVNVDILSGNNSAAALSGVATFSVEDAERELKKTYEQFITGEDERLAFGRAIRAVADSRGASVVHCTEGKDRTGWISAVLQLLAGVGEQDVMADYLLTRELSAEFDKAILEFVKAQMPEQLDAIRVLIQVQEADIRRSLELLHSQFGDVRRYLVDGAGLESSLVEDLAARLRAE